MNEKPTKKNRPNRQTKWMIKLPKLIFHFRPIQYFTYKNWYGIRKYVNDEIILPNKYMWLLDIGSITIGFTI